MCKGDVVDERNTAVMVKIQMHSHRPTIRRKKQKLSNTPSTQATNNSQAQKPTVSKHFNVGLMAFAFRPFSKSRLVT